jgi:hypothetical protein
MEDTPVDLFGAEEPQKPVDLRPDNYTPPPDDKTVDSRSFKAAFGLGDLQRMGQIREEILRGEENQLRELEATKANLAAQEQKSHILQSIARESGRDATPDEVEFVRTFNSWEGYYPETILENRFAQKVISNTMGNNLERPSVTTAAMEKDERRTLDNADIFSSVIERQQAFQKIYEDTASQAQKRGWISTIWDFTKSVLPGVSWANIWSKTLNRPVSGVSLPGNTIEDLVRYVWSRPLAEGVKEAHRITEELKTINIEDALIFSAALLRYTSSDVFWNNSIGIADLSSGAGVARKGIARVMRNRTEFGAGVADQERLMLPPPQRLLEPPRKMIEDRNAIIDLPNPLRSPTPPVKEGFVRLYHGGHNTDSGGGRWVTPDPEYARNFRAFGDPNPVSYVDVPKGSPVEISARAWDEIDEQGGTNMVGRYQNVEIPEEWAKKLKPFERQREPQSMGLVEWDYIGRGLVPDREPNKRVFRILEDVTEDVRKARANDSTDIPQFLPSRPNAPRMGVVEADYRGRTTPETPKREFPITAVEDTTDEIAQFNTAMKDTVRSLDRPGVKFEDHLAESGNVAEAARINHARLSQSDDVDDLLAQLPTFVNPSNWLGRGTVIAAERTRRIAEQFNRMSSGLLDTMRGNVHVPRITGEARQAGFRATEEMIWRDYGSNPRVNDGILDVAYVPAEAFQTNTDKVVFRLGDPRSALLFGSRQEAEYARANLYGFEKGEAVPVQQGTGWVLHLAKNVDETQDAVRDLLVTPKNATPVNPWNMMLSRIRSVENLLSPEQNQRRKLATHVPQNLNEQLRGQYLETANRLTPRQRKNVDQILIENRDWPDPVTSQRGRFFQNAAEFEQAYMNRFNKMPDVNEINHYFNFTRLSDFEWYIRNLGVYRDKARKGLEQFSFDYYDANGVRQTLPFFEGKKIDDIPWDGQDAIIAIYDSGARQLRTTYKHATINQPRTISKADIDHLINHGYDVIQVADSKTQVLADLGLNSHVNFILVSSPRRKGLSWQQVDYRPGGHSVYRDPWYIKQPIIATGLHGKSFYYGDANAFNFTTEAQARQHLGHLNTARRMMVANDPGLANYVATHLGLTEPRFRQMFHSGKFSPDHDFTVARQGLNTFETETSLKKAYPDVVDGSKSQWDLTALEDRAFLADRDHILPSLSDRGGVISVTQSRQLNPYQSLQRGLSQAVGNLWMNDYKIGAVEQWLKEFSGVMKAPEHKLYDAPLYYLYRKDIWDNTAERDVLAAAKANQRAILNFIGQRSEIQTSITFLQNKLMNSIYSRFGEKVSQVVSDVGLGLIRDPASYARAVAFHTQLGVFNPVQLIVQAQGMNHVFAVAGPKTGLQASAAAFLMRRLAHTDDPAIINSFAQKARKWGWTPNEFKEMYETARKSGIYHVVGEAALRNDVFDPKIIRSPIGRFLDKGTFFFAEGERVVRLSAHAAAYKQWRKANPTREIDNRALAEIADRGDLLSVNMTRKSLSDFQNGILGIPTQFATFQLRLMEQMLGKQLTLTEKARAMGWYSMMYGIPTGVLGTTAGLYPWYDDIREEALSRGIDLSPAYIKLLAEGMGGFMVSTITGKDYNWAARLGPGQFTTLRDYWRGDKGLDEVLIGASGTIIGSILESTEPLAKDLASVIFGGPDFPYQHTDVTKVVKNIATMGTAAKVIGIAFYGEYWSKNNQLLSDRMEPVDAIMALAGLTPQHITDNYLRLGEIKDEKAGKEQIGKQVIENIRLAGLALKDRDMAKYDGYMKRARVYRDAGKFTYQEELELWQRGNELIKPMDRSVEYDFMVRRARPDRAIDRFKTYYKEYYKQKEGQ